MSRVCGICTVSVVLSLSAFCEGSLKVLEALNQIEAVKLKGLYDLNQFSTQLHGFVDSLSALASRIWNAIDLVTIAAVAV